MIDALTRAKRVLITTHIRPDGDALGSCAAMSLALRSKGIEAHVLLLSHLPSKYAFVFEEPGIAYTDVEKGWPDSLSLENFDTFLSVDTGTWSQLPGLKERLEKFRGKKLVIDHHLTQEQWADTKLVVTKAAAAGEVVEDLLHRWLVELTPSIATAIFVALVSDTGWFQFASTTAHTMRLGARLLEAGVDIDRIYQLLYQNERPQRLALQNRVQGSLELLADGRLAVMKIRRQDFLDTNAAPGDTENVINFPMQIKTVQVSLLFAEPMDDSPIRVSLRSKGAVDVAKFAQQFGGGGHARAAGLKVVGSLDQVREQVVGKMTSQLRG